MMRCGKFVIAPRADRGVRPYKTLCVFADGVCNSAITHCLGERGIDPYGHIAFLPMVFTILRLHPARERQAPPLRYDEVRGFTHSDIP